MKFIDIVFVLGFGLAFCGLLMYATSVDDTEAREAGYSPSDCSGAYYELLEVDMAKHVGGGVLLALGLTFVSVSYLCQRKGVDL